jgi:hypothetical protein
MREIEANAHGVNVKLAGTADTGLVAARDFV